MNKVFVFPLVAFALLTALMFGTKSAVDKNHLAFANAAATPTPLAEIERIAVDKKEAIYACVCPGFKRLYPNGCGRDEKGNVKPDNLLITVHPIVRKPKKTPLVYDYAVSGGKILGQGDKIVWNLEGIRPGTYTITASIKGKRGVSAETKTETVTVRECDCDCPCLCPDLSIKTVKEGRASESLVFSAKVLGGTVVDITYRWTVSQGEIVNGQGTPQIKIQTTREMTGTVTATLEISGSGLCAECPRTASETVSIIK